MSGFRQPFRQILPKLTAPPVIKEKPAKRRKIASACDCCKKRKVKCDGVRPKCGKCVDANVECIFSAEVAAEQAAQAKGEEAARTARYQGVIDLLRNGSLADSVQALQTFRDAENLDDAMSSIAEARLLLPAPGPGAAASAAAGPSGSGSRRRSSPLLRSPYDDSDFIFEKQYMVTPREQYVDKDIFVDLSSRTLPLSRWTTVSDDNRLMNHLLTLFFTWDNIVERCIYRPILEADIKDLDPDTMDSGPGAFCSRFLVNALLAVSCIYTMDPNTFKDPDDPKSRGRLWADEAEAHLVAITEPSLPLLQGLLAMFVYEGNLGSGTKALPYLMRSFEEYRALNEGDVAHPEGTDEARLEHERQAVSWCMWGFYCTEWRGSQALGFRKPALKPRIGQAWRERGFPLSQPDSIGYWWFPYPMSVTTQRSMQVEVREADVRLSELVEEVLNLTYPEEGQLPPRARRERALELYDALADWKLSLPARIRFEEAVLGSTVLLHVAVELLMASLLRPYSGSTKQEFGRLSPRDRFFAHACSIMSAVWTFRSLACIRFEYWLVHPIGTAAHMVLLHGDEPDSGVPAPAHMDTLARACKCLDEMRVMLPLATDVLSGIRAAFRRCGLAVPAYLGRYFDEVRHRKDGLMHHTVAALLPTARDAGRGEMQLQALLDEFDELAVD